MMLIRLLWLAEDAQAGVLQRGVGSSKWVSLTVNDVCRWAVAELMCAQYACATNIRSLIQ
jgi:hypothetical protein